MIYVDGTLYLSVALLLLLLPLKWLLSAAIAALVHELFHLATLILVRGHIKRISITPTGCVILTDSIGEVQQFLSILAGPVGSLCLLKFRCTVPELAVCGLFHGLYNLLPILPLDGGRLLRILLLRIIPEKTESILQWIRKLLCYALLLFGIFLCFCDERLLSYIILFAVLCIGRLLRKTPCKATKSKVQ